MTEKKCNKCKETKLIDYFHKKESGKYGVSSSCKQCVINYANQYRLDNADKIRQKRKDSYLNDREGNLRRQARFREKHRSKLREAKRRKALLKFYGITFEDYKRMWIVQEGKCAICGTFQTDTKDKKALSVDHDHITGAIRQLLCTNCNLVIGNAKEDIGVLSKSIEYLNKWKNN